MRYVLSAILAATCLVAGCAKPPPVEPGQASVSGQSSGGMVVELQSKDGRSFKIPLPPPNGKPDDVKGVDDLFDAFMNFCLESFPDDAAVAAKAQAAGYQPLTPDQVNHILHGDPGRGWDVRIKDSVIALTIELPPYHSCGVHVFLPTEPDIGMTMATFVGLWGYTQSPQEILVPGQDRTVTTRGVVEDMRPWALVDSDKRLVEQIGAYITHYPNMGQVELRLVRMRGNNPH